MSDQDYKRELHRRRVGEPWTTNKGAVGSEPKTVYVPRGELPICCPDSKQPTPQPNGVGSLYCAPETGGCGATWVPPTKR